MIACINSLYPLIELLIKSGANINKENAAGSTPFHSVCLNGNTKAVDLLIDHNADFMKRDKVIQ
jgi:ankyrin repeat protein